MADPSKAGEGQYIVQGADVASGRLMEHVKADEAITPVRQIAKDVLVLSMTPERADQLKQHFGAQLVVERDADLKLNTGPTGP
jgi:hypothetical protein